jgi:Alpha-glucuronidase
MLAAALAPHHGVVVWRAFVYDYKPGYDRAGAPYAELQPFDGKFAPNVLLQVKNGPVDFQPREPFHPLFGGMPRTQVIPELQITQEYLGFFESSRVSGDHVAGVSGFRNCCQRTTLDREPGGGRQSISSTNNGNDRRGNTGTDRNWTGHHFAQANWYAFGRWRGIPTSRRNKSQTSGSG